MGEAGVGGLLLRTGRRTNEKRVKRRGKEREKRERETKNIHAQE